MSTSTSATINVQLTNYAQGNYNDLKEVVAVAERLAPSTPVSASSGQYKKFDDKNSFKPEKTGRALGGDPVVIKFDATDGNFNCTPQALEARVDKEEENKAGVQNNPVAAELLDQGKIKALVNKTGLSHARDVCDFVVANTVPVADRGNFSNPEIDPIEQIDEQLEGLSIDVGSTMGIKITLDVGTWRIIRNHKLVKARCSGVQVGGISKEQFAAMFSIPADVMIANVVQDIAALGQAANKKRLLAGVLFAHYSVPNPTQYDPSAFKCFTVGQLSLIHI